MKNIFKIAFWAILLIAGFVFGSKWKNTEVASSNNEKFVNEKPKAIQTSLTSNTSSERFLTSEEKTTINLFENSAPSVAYINTSTMRTDYFHRRVTKTPSGSGSAFVWDKEGHIITNYHVIKGVDRAKVILSDGSEWDASLVGVAPEKDLAVLKIDAPKKLLSPLKVGRSDNLLVGQSVYAIGNPFGLDQTLTTGIISALDREIESVVGVPIKGAIQTDAAINPGNSGGPLLDSSGKLIGVNTMIYSPSGAYAGIGFCIPSDVVSWVVPDLIKYGKVMRPTLGIEMASPSLMRRLKIEGIMIMGLFEGGAADRANLQATYRSRNGTIHWGDIITKIGNDKITSKNDLILSLEQYKEGDVVKVEFIREKEIFETKLKLGAPN